MSKKKKIVLLSSMMVLLVATAVCNFVFTGGNALGDPSVTTNANYFSQRRTERASSRNETLLQLDAVIASAEATSQAKESALKTKAQIAENTERELLLEVLIKSQGFEDAVVIIGLDSENVNVIVKDDNLTEDESVAIYTIIQEEAARSPENVKIMPIS